MVMECEAIIVPYKCHQRASILEEELNNQVAKMTQPLDINKPFSPSYLSVSLMVSCISIHSGRYAWCYGLNCDPHPQTHTSVPQSVTAFRDRTLEEELLPRARGAMISPRAPRWCCCPSGPRRQGQHPGGTRGQGIKPRKIIVKPENPVKFALLGCGLLGICDPFFFQISPFLNVYYVSVPMLYFGSK